MQMNADLLLRAYALGIFPMAESRDDPGLQWIDPRQRGIIPLDGLHVPRRLRRVIRQAPFEIIVDGDFSAVIHACAQPRPGHPDTWISPQIEALYGELHEIGGAHSVECRISGELVGGLYGVSLGAAFFGESMFSLVTDASKVALVALVWLLRQGGYLLLDTQFQTEHLARFGCLEIPRETYKTLLGAAIKQQAQFPKQAPTALELSEFLDRLQDPLPQARETPR